jgi:alkaline phosphatase D
LKEANVKNFVVLTGDLHSFIAGSLKENFDDPAEVDYDGVCFMAGSVTSSNLTEIGTNGVGFPAPGVTDPEAYKASNPHITFFNSETHGYNVMEVTPDLLTCRMVSVNPIKVKEPRPPATPLRTFTVPRDQYVILGDV